tara:strand:+ start:888 stop:1169 length:282 start_codon:yes stop_codon:yes gene_type:complete
MKNLDIGSSKQTNKTFEITLLVKDNQGNSTGFKKNYTTDDPVKLSNFWNCYSGVHKKKKRKTKAATGQEVNRGLKEAAEYADKIQKEKDVSTE